jgi:hypothetical protein|tara:strand:+ start:182 stop:352 length:171 start_codon:yes stop_codon:yes gene_type:complete
MILLMVVKKYLIKLFVCGSTSLVSELKWETEQKVGDLILEVSKSLPRGIRATIEEI